MSEKSFIKAKISRQVKRSKTSVQEEPPPRFEQVSGKQPATIS
jgi:hypothetical protein